MEVAIFSAAVRSSSVLDDTRFAVEVLSRLPLADSVWRLLHYAMEDSWLDHLWARHRGRCYEKQLKFRTLAHLITDALIEHQGSGHQAFTRRGNRALCRSRSPRPTTSSGTCPCPSARPCSRKAPSGSTRFCLRSWPWTRCRTVGPGSKSLALTARRSSTFTGCSSRCAACRRESWVRGRRWA